MIVRTTHIADAAEALGCPVAGGGGTLRWLGGDDAVVIGRAFTLHQRAVRDPKTASKAPARHKEVAASLAQPGDLIVLAVEGRSEGATWGEAHMMRALARGVEGVLTDGLIRDAGAMRARGAPILFQGGCPLRSNGRIETVDIRVDVEIMNVRISHGDLIAMDADGFVRVSQSDAVAVLERAREIARNEHIRNQALLNASEANEAIS